MSLKKKSDSLLVVNTTMLELAEELNSREILTLTMMIEPTIRDQVKITFQVFQAINHSKTQECSTCINQITITFTQKRELTPTFTQDKEENKSTPKFNMDQETKSMDSKINQDLLNLKSGKDSIKEPETSTKIRQEVTSILAESSDDRCNTTLIKAEYITFEIDLTNS